MWFKKKIEREMISEERKEELIMWMGDVLPNNKLLGEVTEEELRGMLTDSKPESPQNIEKVNFWIEAWKAGQPLSPKTKEELLFVEGMRRSPWKEYAREITGVREREERMIPEGENVFMHYGDRWYVRFNGGKPAWFINSQGMHYIAYLLKNPGKIITAGELESEIMGMEALTGVKNPGQSFKTQGDESETDDEEVLADIGGSGQSIQSKSDDQARADYKKRMIEIVREMQQARDDNNSVEIENLQDELELLQKESQQFVLSGNKKVGRTFSDNREQARDRVRKIIDKCLKHMKIRDKKLAMHLNDRISKGFNLMYSPDPEIIWKF